MDPNLFKLAELRHQERLQEAENARRFQGVRPTKSDLRKSIQAGLGSLLIGVGQKLKAYSLPSQIGSVPR